MGRPKTYDRADVLDRATRVFWDRGYEGTHVAALVEATGLNRFSLYNEFGGKAGLFRAALDHYVDGLAGVLAPLDADPPGLANVRAFHRAQLGYGFRHGCFALNTIREKHVVPAGVWEAVEAFTARIHAGLLRNLQAARDAGELSPEREPERLATVLSVYDVGLLAYRALRADPDELEPLVEEIERLLD